MFFTVRYSSWASDFGGKARPCQGQAFSGMLESFRAAEKIPCCVFEDTNIRLRTDEGVTFKSRQREHRPTSSLGCKIRVKWKTEKGFLPVPTYATLCQRLPVAKNMVQVCKQILYFACAFIRTASHQQVFVNEYRQFYMNIFS